MGTRQDKIAFLRRVFGGITVESDGVNVAVRCPNSKCTSIAKGKRKLSIQLETDQSHCWVCGLKTRNTLVPVLRKICSAAEIQEYVTKFKPKGRSLLAPDDSDQNQERVYLPGGFRLLGQLSSSRDPDVLRAIRYLTNRGLSERDLWFYKIGLSSEPLFERRVIIPSFDEDGYLNTYAARTIDKRGFPNYLVPSVDRIGIIFNEIHIDWSKELTLVEGPFDLIKCVGNAACLQGSTLNEDHLLFWKIVSNMTPIVLALDADATHKTIRIAKLLASYNVPVRILNVAPFSDVGEMTHADFKTRIAEAKPWDSLMGLRMKIDAWSPASGSV